MLRCKKVLALLFPLALLAGCQVLGRPAGTLPVSDDELVRAASAGPLEAAQAQLITDNDQALLSKVELIEGAQRTLDLAYYIFADDYSSSYLARALVDAARRGVAVRLLVDYGTNYKRLDWFSMMERLGNSGRGSLQVRFYNRPTRNIIRDATYLTLGCGKEAAVRAPKERCSEEKFAAIDKLFADETIDGKPAESLNLSNLNVRNSGLFLSGLYAKRPDLMATAAMEGQDIDLSKLNQGASSVSPKDKQNLLKVAKIYWNSRTAPAFQRVLSKAELYLVFSAYGSKLDPIRDTVSALLPLGKEPSAESLQDWNHLTDFSHHKLILADESRLQMGGRNVEDSYHMHPNPMTEKYVFMDTDVRADLSRGGVGVRQAFDVLWNFKRMVASLAEVRQHAPNEVVANLDVFLAAQKDCGGSAQKPADEACVDRAFQAGARDLDLRIQAHAAEMERKAQVYREQYLPKIPAAGDPSFAVDGGALLAYLENLPFDRSLPPDQRRRIYGAPVDRVAASGKHIHDVWLRAFADVCRAASKENPKRIILHNAYFFPPANMTAALSSLINGDQDCSNVNVTVLTNSIETTDLNVVNLLARHALKAFAEFDAQYRKPGRSAHFDYYEYLPPADAAKLSLHSKVSVLGDDLMVGSANADVRSFYMDSNNALLIRRAPVLNAAYTAFVDSLLADATRTQKLNDYFSATPRATMMQEDLATLGQLLEKYRADQRLDQAQRAKLEQRFSETLDDAYRLTKQAISPDASAASRRQLQDQFNELFKPI